VRRAVFLDRDGVLNRAIVRAGKPYAPTTIDQFELLPDVREATYALRGAGFLVVVVTNQPDVAAGRQSRATVAAMHERLRGAIAVDDIRVCFHTDADACSCRKPGPGMLRAAAREWHIDLRASVMVGDRWRDIDAGRAAGCRTVWVRQDYDEPIPHGFDAQVASLARATHLILTGALDPIERTSCWTLNRCA
jgi:D-glycero-D-manno-heptose 1,7-bisphosphate phosphatase